MEKASSSSLKIVHITAEGSLIEGVVKKEEGDDYMEDISRVTNPGRDPFAGYAHNVVKKEDEEEGYIADISSTSSSVSAKTKGHAHDVCCWETERRLKLNRQEGGKQRFFAVEVRRVVNTVKAADPAIPKPMLALSVPLKKSPLELAGYGKISLAVKERELKRMERTRGVPKGIMGTGNDKHSTEVYHRALLEERMKQGMEMELMKKKVKDASTLAKDNIATLNIHEVLSRKISSLKKERDELLHWQTLIFKELDRARETNKELVSKAKKREWHIRRTAEERRKRNNEKKKDETKKIRKKRVSYAGASDWRTRKRRREELDEYLNSIVAEGDEQEKLEEKLDLVMAWAQGKKVCLERKDKEQSSGETV